MVIPRAARRFWMSPIASSLPGICRLENSTTSPLTSSIGCEASAIRANAEVAKTTADLSGAEADLRKARANLGAPGMNNPKVRQAIAALDQARLDLGNTEVRAPANGIVTNLRLAPGQEVAGDVVDPALLDLPLQVRSPRRQRRDRIAHGSDMRTP